MPQRDNTGAPEPYDLLAELFGLPTGQWRVTYDSSPVAPPRPGRLHAILSWLWETMLHGCAAYGFSMYPYVGNPSNLFDVPGPRPCEPAQQATVAPAGQSALEGGWDSP
jgi:hypothetical protein